MRPGGAPLRLPPSGFRRADLSTDLADQLGRLGEPHRLVEREHEGAVDLDVVDAVRPRHESEVRELLPEFLQDRVRVLDRLELVTAGYAVPNKYFRHDSVRRASSNKKVRRLRRGPCRRGPSHGIVPEVLIR